MATGYVIRLSVLSLYQMSLGHNRIIR